MNKILLNKIINNRILFLVFFVCVVFGCTSCGTTLKIKMQFEQDNSGYLEFIQNTEPTYFNEGFVSEQIRSFSKAGFNLEVDRKDSFTLINRFKFNNFGDELKYLIEGHDGNDSFQVNIFETKYNYERIGLNITPNPVKRGFLWNSQEIILVICQDKHIGQWDHWSGKAEIVMPFDDIDYEVIEETEKDIPSKINLEVPYKKTLFIYFDHDAGEDPRDTKKWYTIRIKSSQFNLNWKELLTIIATILGIIATIFGIFKRKRKE